MHSCPFLCEYIYVCLVCINVFIFQVYKPRKRIHAKLKTHTNARKWIQAHAYNYIISGYTCSCMWRYLLLYTVLIVTMVV